MLNLAVIEHPRFPLAALCAGLLLTGPLTVAAQERDLTDHLRYRLQALQAGHTLEIAERPLREPAELQELYAHRVYRPVWFDDGRLAAYAGSVAALLAAADAEGLHPDDYHAAALERMVLEAPGATEPERVTLELALTDAVLAYTSDMLTGRVQPESLFPAWESPPRDLDPSSRVREILASNDPVRALKALAPAHRNYQRLRELLARFRDIERSGGWTAVSQGPALKAGATSNRVAALRHRLIQSGDLSVGESPSHPQLFDTDLQSAVTRYQRRHGLEPDGVAGTATIESLNIPVSRRIRTTELNMERWRWLPRDLGTRFITVNIAGFELTLVEHGEPQLTLPVVVGKRYHATPVFTGMMTYLVFSPYWNVPPGIARREILPKLIQDPGYLERESMKVFKGWTQPGTPLDPATIDWTSVDPNAFPYRFRQEPGPANALGTVKFMFPNKYNVYLHDTPAKELFKRTTRDFSHGCIRVKDPLHLAEYLLRDTAGWDARRIDEAAGGGVERAVALSRPWPVHLLYWTAWVGAQGDVHFRQDIYGRDERLAEALHH